MALQADEEPQFRGGPSDPWRVEQGEAGGVMGHQEGETPVAGPGLGEKRAVWAVLGGAGDLESCPQAALGGMQGWGTLHCTGPIRSWDLGGRLWGSLDSGVVVTPEQIPEKPRCLMPSDMLRGLW